MNRYLWAYWCIGTAFILLALLQFLVPRFKKTAQLITVGSTIATFLAMCGIGPIEEPPLTFWGFFAIFCHPLLFCYAYWTTERVEDWVIPTWVRNHPRISAMILVAIFALLEVYVLREAVQWCEYFGKEVPEWLTTSWRSLHG